MPNESKLIMPTFKRQWGAEKRTEPLPSVHAIPSAMKIALSGLAIVATIVLWFMYFITSARQLIDNPANFRFDVEAISYLIVVTFLTFSALMYLQSRRSAYMRFRAHVRVPRAEIYHHFETNKPSITVLVPSYNEEVAVIRKTLLSAYLQEYPKIRIVLLLDNNPNPKDRESKNKLNESRALAKNIMELFDPPRKRFNTALKNFEKTRPSSRPVSYKQIKSLAGHYAWAAEWLNKMADNETIEDHVDIFFSEQVLRGLANDLSLTSSALLASHEDKVKLPYDRIYQLYNRLSWIFGSEVDFFERKKYASLSHDSNKAMNLNAYIHLMGGRYDIRQTSEGSLLIPAARKNHPDIMFQDSEFLLTLDADSILLKEYCLRLVYFLQQSGNEKVAVVQTPYSSFRGAATRIERIASATTDVQHILHQGMTYHDATFWVGANAVIRKKSLEDIEESEWKGGFEIKRYIQDRTVIEDTESSIDMTSHDWKLINYPERLSYSATPSDFGSLVVQRRRWSNGGLLILPRFLSQIRDRKHRHDIVSRSEAFQRINYMASIAWASIGLLFLLVYPYNTKLLSPFIVLAALPYFMAMSSDLKYCGYKRSDIFRIYGFNLILLPVNLAGILKSIQQALTRDKTPFARTPKVKNRTIAPMIYVISPLLIVGFSLFTLWRDRVQSNWGNAAFAAFNAVVALWAIIAYIGIFNTIRDTWHGLTAWLYVDIKPSEIPPEEDEQRLLDWKAVLYHGDEDNALPLKEAPHQAIDNSNNNDWVRKYE